MTTTARVRPNVKFVFDTGVRLGSGKALLLEMIGQHGSISAAGAAIGMSYRRAWLLVDEVNRMFRQPSVIAHHGGKSGGGAELTAFGKDLIERYHAMEAKAATAYADDLAWLAQEMDPAFKRAGKDPT